MATHSSILAWRIPGMGKPGGLPSVYGVAQSRTRLKRLGSSSRLVITFLPRSKLLLISWLHSPSAVILEPCKIKYFINFIIPLIEQLLCAKVCFKCQRYQNETKKAEIPDLLGLPLWWEWLKPKLIASAHKTCPIVPGSMTYSQLSPPTRFCLQKE